VDWSDYRVPSSASNWWKNIVDLDKVVPGNNWFVESVIRKVGNGNSTLFWSTKWIGEVPLALVYPRLYSLSNQKDCKVVDLLEQDGVNRV
jgi:hypothetical protein